MIVIEPQAWRVMIEHARAAYPRECCGLLLGQPAPSGRIMRQAIPTRNVFAGDQHDRFEIDPADLARVQRESRQSGLDIIGVFHSHPDDDAYFSKTDLENACPWYASVVLSIRQGEYAGAACFNVDPDQTAATPEPFEIPD